MTHLRQKMLDELQRRNYSQNTVNTYLHAVEDFSRYFHRSPDRLGPDHIIISGSIRPIWLFLPNPSKRSNWPHCGPSSSVSVIDRSQKSSF